MEEVREKKRKGKEFNLRDMTCLAQIRADLHLTKVLFYFT